VIQASNWGLECATNSPIMNGLPSSPCWPNKPGNQIHDRRFLNGIFWVLRSERLPMCRRRCIF
jgi:hypothetical protein